MAAAHGVVACPWPFGELCDVIRSIADLVGSLGELVRDPFLWLLHHLFPREFLDLLAGQLDAGGDDNLYSRLYRAIAPAGVAVAAVAGTMRVVRSVYDERVGSTHLVVDNLTRFGAAALVLASPTPSSLTGDGMPVGWQVIRLGTNSSLSIARAALGLLGSPAVFHADVSARAFVGRFIALAGLASVPVLGFFFAVILLIVGIGILYMAMIMIARSIMLAFAIAAAPLCIATAVFDPRNRFFQWWTELFTGALLIPVVMAFTLALTTGFALQMPITPASFLPVTGVLLGGMWFTGKVVHQLAWRHFSHGGVTGAITALSTTAMAVPNLAVQAGALAARAGLAGGAAAGAARAAGGGRDGADGGGGRGPAGGGGPQAGEALASGAGALADAAAGSDPLAAAGARSGAQFRGGVGGAGGASLDRAAGAAIGSFAGTAAGRAAVMSATAAMPAGTPMEDRVIAYARQLSADPGTSSAIGAGTVASVLGGSLPDVGGIVASPQGAPA